MADERSDVWLVDGVRTPFGKFRGALSSLTAVELGEIAAAELAARHGPDAIDGAVIGNVLQGGNGQNPARRIAVRGGFAPSTYGLTLNDVCLSSVTSLTVGSGEVARRDGCWLVGGADSMSQGERRLTAVGRDAEVPTDAPALVFHDGLTCAFEGALHGAVADVDDRRLGITRLDVDAYALSSFERAAAAQDRGVTARQVVPVSTDRGHLDVDEGVRATSLEQLAALRPAFAADGTVTPGNASQMSDGASLGLLASDAWVQSRGIEPLARVVTTAHVAGVGGSLHELPAMVVERLLGDAGLHPGDIDLYEINEAFAGVVLASSRRLGLDPDHVNVDGGAIAVGHPLAASGLRLVLTLVHALRERGLRRGVAALCGGGGQGAAVLVELPDA